MAPSDYKEEKLSRLEARKQISKIMNSTRDVHLTGHAVIEAENDGLTYKDVADALKNPSSKIIEEGEFSRGSYRYRVHFEHIVVVISFSSDGNRIIVVTVWDK